MTQCGLCKDCKWWERLSDKYKKHLKGSIMPGFSECSLSYNNPLALVGSAIIPQHDDDEFEVDGFDIIVTHGYFGCIQFEPKTEGE